MNAFGNSDDFVVLSTRRIEHQIGVARQSRLVAEFPRSFDLTEQPHEGMLHVRICAGDWQHPSLCDKGSGLFDAGVKECGVILSCKHQRRTSSDPFTIEVGRCVFTTTKKPDP